MGDCHNGLNLPLYCLKMFLGGLHDESHHEVADITADQPV